MIESRLYLFGIVGVPRTRKSFPLDTTAVQKEWRTGDVITHKVPWPGILISTRREGESGNVKEKLVYKYGKLAPKESRIPGERKPSPSMPRVRVGGTFLLQRKLYYAEHPPWDPPASVLIPKGPLED